MHLPTVDQNREVHHAKPFLVRPSCTTHLGLSALLYRGASVPSPQVHGDIHHILDFRPSRRGFRPERRQVGVVGDTASGLVGHHRYSAHTSHNHTPRIRRLRPALKQATKPLAALQAVGPLELGSYHRCISPTFDQKVDRLRIVSTHNPRSMQCASSSGCQIVVALPNWVWAVRLDDFLTIGIKFVVTNGDLTSFGYCQLGDLNAKVRGVASLSVEVLPIPVAFADLQDLDERWTTSSALPSEDGPKRRKSKRHNADSKTINAKLISNRKAEKPFKKLQHFDPFILSNGGGMMSGGKLGPNGGDSMLMNRACGIVAAASFNFEKQPIRSKRFPVILTRQSKEPFKWFARTASVGGVAGEGLNITVDCNQSINAGCFEYRILRPNRPREQRQRAHSNQSVHRQIHPFVIQRGAPDALASQQTVHLASARVRSVPRRASRARFSIERRGSSSFRTGMRTVIENRFAIGLHILLARSNHTTQSI